MSSGRPVPPHLWTVGEYLELGRMDGGQFEIDEQQYELVEGRLEFLRPRRLRHGSAVDLLRSQLRGQLPPGIDVVIGADVDLHLAPADAPGSVRQPDLVAMPRERVRRADHLISACDVVIAIDVRSPGSRRTDPELKRGEHARAGIPHYWILDVNGPASLLACHLTGDSGFVDGGVVTGTFTTSEPFPITIDLDEMTSLLAV